MPNTYSYTHTHTHAFVTTLNEKQGVMLSFQRGGLILQLRPNRERKPASRTLFCLETNYFNASKIDFICLCCLALSLFPLLCLFNISNSYTSPLYLISSSFSLCLTLLISMFWCIGFSILSSSVASFPTLGEKQA